MKRRLLALLTLGSLLGASSVSAMATAHNPCDGLNVNLVNHAGVAYEVKDIQFDDNSRVENLDVGNSVSSHSKKTFQAYSGKGTRGKAMAKVTLRAENESEAEDIELYYKIRGGEREWLFVIIYHGSCEIDDLSIKTSSQHAVVASSSHNGIDFSIIN